MPVAKRIEDENEDDDEHDIPENCVSPAQYHQFLTTWCQKKRPKGLKCLTKQVALITRYHLL